jgi:hypothetical protein
VSFHGEIKRDLPLFQRIQIHTHPHWPIKCQNANLDVRGMRSGLWDYQFQVNKKPLIILSSRTDQQTFGVAICTLNFRSMLVHSEQIQFLPIDPLIAQELIHHPTFYSIRKTQKDMYLLEDPIFPRQMYKLHNGYVDSDDCLELRYDIRDRKREIDGPPGDYMCINDGIDKTCGELSIYMANLKSGTVENFSTSLAEDGFPFKCEGRLTGNVNCQTINSSLCLFQMQSIPFEKGVIALFSYEPRSDLYAFAYLDFTTLKWQDLHIRLTSSHVQFQVVGKDTLMIMEIENDAQANPSLKRLHRLKIG